MILTDPESVQERKTLFKVCTALSAALLVATTLLIALTRPRPVFVEYLTEEFLLFLVVDIALLLSVLMPQRVFTNYGPRIVKGKVKMVKSQSPPDDLALRHGSMGVGMALFNLGLSLFAIGGRIDDLPGVLDLLMFIVIVLCFLACALLVAIIECRIYKSAK